MVPDFFDRSKVSDSDLDGGGEAQGDVTECFLSVLIPDVSVISGTHIGVNKPLALCLKVGLHCGVPLLPVGACEHGNHLVESAGHGDILLGVNRVSK